MRAAFALSILVGFMPHAIADTVTVRFDGMISDSSTVPSSAGVSLNGAPVVAVVTYDPNQAPSEVFNNNEIADYRNDTGGVFDLRVFVGDFFAQSLFDTGTFQRIQVQDTTEGVPTPAGNEDQVSISAFPLLNTGGNTIGDASIAFFRIALRSANQNLLDTTSIPKDLSALDFEIRTASVEFVSTVQSLIVRDIEITSITVVPVPSAALLLLSGLASTIVLRRHRRARGESDKPTLNLVQHSNAGS